MGSPMSHLDPSGDPIIADAETSIGRKPEERYLMFASIMRMVDAIWSGLSDEEVRRRLRIAEALDPRPDPWWKDVKPEGR